MRTVVHQLKPMSLQDRLSEGLLKDKRQQYFNLRPCTLLHVDNMGEIYASLDQGDKLKEGFVKYLVTDLEQREYGNYRYVHIDRIFEVEQQESNIGDLIKGILVLGGFVICTIAYDRVQRMVSPIRKYFQKHEEQEMLS